MTLGDVLQKNKGLGPGFDFLRMALSLCVVLFHAFQLTYGRSWNPGVAAPAIQLIVPAFFALSGFLVAGSMLRVRDVRTFVLFRAIRILPALAVEITLSALVLGPIVTSLPLQEYFTSAVFWTYFANVVGWIHYTLPGVFLTNPMPDIVNGQLWTVPAELHCYVLLALLMFLRVATRPRVLLAVLIALAGLESATVLLPGHVWSKQTVTTEEMQVLCFLCGNVFYLWRDRIEVQIGLFLLSAVGFAVVAAFVPALGFTVGVLSATYFITYLGMKRLPAIPLLMSGEYSYGIYLYSFALQQTVAWALPGFGTWWLNLLLGGGLAVIVAALSWFCVEKPCLRLRKLFAPRVAIARPVVDGKGHLSGERT